jgi:hypothetical protein
MRFEYLTVDRSGNCSLGLQRRSAIVHVSLSARPDTIRCFVQTPCFQNAAAERFHSLARFNTAGIRFTRHIFGQDDGESNIEENNRDQLNMRSTTIHPHKLSFVYTYERTVDVAPGSAIRPKA